MYKTADDFIELNFICNVDGNKFRLKMSRTETVEEI